MRKGNNAAAIRSVAIELPHGLSFRHGRSHGRSRTVVQLIGAGVRSVRLVRGRLLIVLNRAVGTVTIRVKGIRESASLEHKAKHHRLRSLRLGVGVTDASGLGTLLRVVVRTLRL